MAHVRPHLLYHKAGLLVQSGALLGKGGARINQIRSDSGATVRLIGLEPEEERGLPRDIGPGHHRTLCISGESNCVLRALSTVTDLLRDCQVPLSPLLSCHLLPAHATSWHCWHTLCSCPDGAAGPQM